MKKIILLILMLSPFANADMDKICSIVLYKDDMTNWQTKLEEEVKQRGCIRNNIFEVAILNLQNNEMDLMAISNQWCRFDRNRKITRELLSCVLYSNKPRTYILKGTS
tara:strand:- start:119 stop:442 length:324 start_codon:yes stop_codon:yes gene_type:complete